MSITVPRRKSGRPSAATDALYRLEMQAFCARMLEFRSAVPFPPSARGWCYVLEPSGLDKGDFDVAENLINDCRKSGDLPLNICGVDTKRAFENVEKVIATTADEEVDFILEQVRDMPDQYRPISFWDDQDHYVQMLAEKGDICKLYAPTCNGFYVPIASVGGWADINVRAELRARFRDWEQVGKQCVLLYIGDFDPGGLRISDKLRSNLEDLAGAVCWHPDTLIIERFGLSFEFIEAHRLTWIDNLKTSSGGDLADEEHKDHFLPYVQDYLHAYCTRDPVTGLWRGRKVESNALLNAAHQEAGLRLCREAILKYVPADAPERYLERLKPLRDEVRELVLERLAEEYGS